MSVRPPLPARPENGTIAPSHHGGPTPPRPPGATPARHRAAQSCDVNLCSLPASRRHTPLAGRALHVGHPRSNHPRATCSSVDGTARPFPMRPIASGYTGHQGQHGIRGTTAPTRPHDRSSFAPLSRRLGFDPNRPRRPEPTCRRQPTAPATRASMLAPFAQDRERGQAGGKHLPKTTANDRAKSGSSSPESPDSSSAATADDPVVRICKQEVAGSIPAGSTPKSPVKAILSADYVDITVFGRQADTCSQYLAKGRKVAIEGRLHHSEWDSDNGRRQRLEVIARPRRHRSAATTSPFPGPTRRGTSTGCSSRCSAARPGPPARTCAVRSALAGHADRSDRPERSVYPPSNFYLKPCETSRRTSSPAVVVGALVGRGAVDGRVAAVATVVNRPDRQSVAIPEVGRNVIHCALGRLRSASIVRARCPLAPFTTRPPCGRAASVRAPSAARRSRGRDVT